MGPNFRADLTNASTPSTPAAAPAWAKPFSSAWRARSYFAVAVTFAILSALFQPAAPTSTAWWEVWLAKGVGSFDKIAICAFYAGLAYAVLSDAFDHIWASSLEKEARATSRAFGSILHDGFERFAAGLMGMSFEAVKVWVESGKGQGDQLKTIGVCSLKSHYGGHHHAPDSLVDFITDDLMENSGFAHSQTWENFITNVRVTDCALSGHFKWQEHKNYLLVCSGASGVLPLRMENSTQIERSQVHAALDAMEFKITVGDEVHLDFKKWWIGHRNKAVDGVFRVQEGGNTVDYDGVWLKTEFARECPIHNVRTRVVVYEESFVSIQDRCYTLALRHPTRRLQANVEVNVENWVVKTPVVSALLYKSMVSVVAVEKHHSQLCSANVPGWTLPGIAMVVEWTPE